MFTNKYDDLIKTLREHSLAAFNNFLTILNIDINLFTHLQDVQIFVGKPQKICLAEYDTENNRIVVDEQYLERELLSMQQQNLAYDDLISNLSVTIIHEFLHANRAILISNGINEYNMDENLTHLMYSIENQEIIRTNRMALDEVISKYGIKSFKRYIPYAIIFNGETYEVYVYNIKKAKFLCFSSKHIEKFMQCEDKWIKISEDLYYNKEDYDFINTFNDILKQKDLVLTAGDFYHNVGELKAKIGNVNENMSNEDYNNILLENQEFLKNRLNQLKSLEESMVEGLANIIELMSDFDYLDYDYIENYFDCIDPHGVLAIKMYKSFDINLIKWFILSAYDEQYYDMIQQIFGSDYNDILQIFDDLYNERTEFDDVIIKFEEIVNRNVNKKK